MAIACLAVASGATCMLLNPAYTADEFDFYLRKRRTQALIIQPDMLSPAPAVAQARGLQLIELQPRREAEAGLFTLTGAGALPSGVPAYAPPDDVALVLYASGTTPQPKSVPLTHAHICSAADHARTALALQEGDRYLHVLPLFHGGWPG
jgi:acyl-CoA synthetase (AMP-forming)/AMP-acid ligase II